MPTTSTPNLDLPPFTPPLTSILDEASCDSASFALYNLVPGISPERLQEICNIPQDEWEEYSMENQAVKPATPTADFAGKSLADVVAAHATMDKDLTPTDGGAAEAGWWPHIFVVVTNENIEDHGLMLVYVDNPYAKPEDEEGPALKKFFFKPEKMGSILSGIALSGDDVSYLHKKYDMDGENGGDSDGDGDDGDEDVDDEE
ncbi:hypothetical protein DM02DRAFT_570151 [Periconia macrospinosa]|uniref:Uncharacterized protein n=1 Tax=Periconia macrospinosa TaxID=97972 RepID=A0A2V1DD99_9PLEO|nr:hypothetical protein DM02DRAFT_570151 [Periconia macrospinosa]